MFSLHFNSNACRMVALALAFSLVLATPAAAQGAQAPPATMQSAQAAPVNVSLLLNQIDAAARQGSVDIAGLRIDKWKTNGEGKQALEQNAESIQRNMTNALPTLVNQVRVNPQDLVATFKLYRNMAALFDVMKSLAETAGAIGSKEEFQMLATHTNSVDEIRLQLANHIEQMAAFKEAELARLRSGGRQAGTASRTGSSPKRIVIDDSAPAKKKKKQ